MFVGRTAERQRILQRVHEIVSGAAVPRVLFLTGEAGIGKSSLLSAVRTDCEALDTPVTYVAADCSTPLVGRDIGEVEALQPWADIITQIAVNDRHERLQVKNLVGELALAWIRCIPVVGSVLESVVDTARIVTRRDASGRSSVSLDADGQQQIFQQYINLLKAISQRAPLTLVLDDAHWCDGSSVNLLFAAARQLQHEPILFIVAYRRDDALSARNGEGHPIIHIQNELERYSLSETIELAGLTSSDLDAFLRTRYSDYVNDDPFESWLSGIAGGNPLFISHYLQTLEADGYIDPRTATIKPGYTRAPVPPSADAVVRERLRRLSEETRELLRYASVEGETFTSLVLASTSAMPQLRLLQALRLAEETHRVIVSQGRRTVYAQPTTSYRFVHLLVHDYLYKSLGDEERLALHEAVLNVLMDELKQSQETGDRLPAVAIRVATHATVLERFSLAGEVLLEGAIELKERFAHDEAERMLEQVFAALELAGESEAVSILQGRSYITRARIHDFRGRYEQMLGDTRSALSVLPSTEAHDRREAAQMEAQALVHLDRFDEADALAERLVSDAEACGDSEGLMRGLFIAARVSRGRDPGDVALARYERCMEAVRQHGSNTITEGDTLNDMGILLRSLGDIARAESCYRRSLEVFESLGWQTSTAVVLNNLGTIALVRGDDEAATQYYTEAIAISRRVGALWNEASCLNNLGEVASFAGDFHLARSRYEQALHIHRLMGNVRMEASCLCNLGHACQELGEYDTASDYYHRSLELYERVGDRNYQAYLNGSLAELSIVRGDLALAHEFLKTAASLDASTRTADTNMVLAQAMAELEMDEYTHQREPERSQTLSSAIEHLERVIAIEEELLPRDVDRWKRTLARAREELESSRRASGADTQ